MTGIEASLVRWLVSISSKLHIEWLVVFLGDYLTYGVVILFCILWLFNKNRRTQLFVFFGTLLSLLVGRGIITELIRRVWDHARPFEVFSFQPIIDHTANASFPSGHAVVLATLAVWGLVMNRRWGWGMAILTVVVGFGRVAAGIHWPADILGGLLVGIGVSALVYWRFLPSQMRPPKTFHKKEFEEPTA